MLVRAAGIYVNAYRFLMYSNALQEQKLQSNKN
jgi:hypothetical protein